MRRSFEARKKERAPQDDGGVEASVANNGTNRKIPAAQSRTLLRESRDGLI
jgi:hypothetical protein